MSTFSDDTKAVALGTLLLGLNGIVASTAVSLLSLVHGYFPVPEDKLWTSVPGINKLMPDEGVDDHMTNPGGKPEVIVRAQSAHRNFTENAVIILAFFIIYSFSGADDSAARALIYVTVAARYVHTFTYILGIGIVRTMAHLLAQATALSVGVIGFQKIYE